MTVNEMCEICEEKLGKKNADWSMMELGDMKWNARPLLTSSSFVEETAMEEVLLINIPYNGIVVRHAMFYCDGLWYSDMSKQRMDIFLAHYVDVDNFRSIEVAKNLDGIPIDRSRAILLAALLGDCPYSIVVWMDNKRVEITCNDTKLGITDGNGYCHCDLLKDKTCVYSISDLCKEIMKFTPMRYAIEKHRSKIFNRIKDRLKTVKEIPGTGVTLYTLDNVSIIYYPNNFLAASDNLWKYLEDDLAETIDMYCVCHKDGDYGKHVAELLLAMKIEPFKAIQWMNGKIDELQEGIK